MTGQHGLTYDDQVAALYDAWFGEWLDSSDAEVTLADLAGSGPVLELGIGTGRVALPLRRRGIDVHGIDASEAMVARLRSKPGGPEVPVTIGDFSELPVEGSFSLVYAVAGTFFELQTQDEQVRCFSRAASRLAPGGVFALDGLVPSESLFSSSQTARVISRRDDPLLLRFRSVDAAGQHYTSHYVAIGSAGVRTVSVPFRYASPGELDLMAKLAGLRLRERLGSWRRDPFTLASGRHVSIYELARDMSPESGG